MSDETQKITTFEFEGGVYDVGRESIRGSMTAARTRALTIGKSEDMDFNRYYKMFHQLLSNVTHVSGAKSIPLVDVDPITTNDQTIRDGWEWFLGVDPFGWENNFWNAWWNANPSVNQWAATPAAYAELLDTEEKKTGTPDAAPTNDAPSDSGNK